MTAESLDIRMARLEGAYTQITERLGGIEERLVHLETRLSGEITTLRSELRQDIARVESRVNTLENRVNTLLYGIIIAILVPIAIRVFFP